MEKSKEMPKWVDDIEALSHHQTASMFTWLETHHIGDEESVAIKACAVVLARAINIFVKEKAKEKEMTLVFKLLKDLILHQ